MTTPHRFLLLIVLVVIFSTVTAAQPRIEPLACSGTVNLSCPGTVSGTLSSSDCAGQNGGWIDQYAIALPEAPFTATVTGASSTPFLIALYDPIDGSIFRSSSGFGSAAIEYRPPDPGLVYTLLVGTTSAAGGAYSLSVSCSAPTPTPGTCVWSGELGCGSNVSGSTAVGECLNTSGTYYYDYYKLPLKKGDVVELSLSSSTPMYLSISEPDFTAGLYSDDGDSSQTLVFTAARDGVHQVSITASDTLRVGSYSIAAKCLSGACGKMRAVRH
jgi:hypothetical protein